MSYTLYKPVGASGSSTVSVPPNAIDTVFWDATNKVGVQYVGQNATDYGTSIAQNTLQMVSNFAGSVRPNDNISLQGQLWFNTTSSTAGNLYVRTSSVNGAGAAGWSRISLVDSSGNLVVSGALSTTGNATIGGALSVTGNTTLTNTTVNGTLSTSGNVTIGGTLTVAGGLVLDNLTSITSKQYLVDTVGSSPAFYQSGNISATVGSNAYGFLSRGTLTATANANGLIAYDSSQGLIATGTFTGLTFYAGRFQGSTWTKSGTGTIATAYGIFADAPSIGTTNYAGYFNGNVTVTGTLSANASSASELQTARTIAATGDGAWSVSFDGSANATAALTLATVNSQPVTNSFQKVTVNGKGLVTATNSVTTADITALVNGTYVNVAGDTMTGPLVLNADPTTALQAATKGYVDAEFVSNVLNPGSGNYQYGRKTFVTSTGTTFMIQWAQGYVPAFGGYTGNIPVTFPIAFDNACFAVTVSASVRAAAMPSQPSISGFSLGFDGFSHDIDWDGIYQYIAIGH